MKVATEYFSKTESAVIKLFEGIQAYLGVLEPMLAPSRLREDAPEEVLNAAIEASLNAQRKFSSESFALCTLCGAVLQVAEKAIDMYSTNTTIPESAADIISTGSRYAKYCIGREVFNLPIGLVILAGRNQHTHFEAKALRQINVSIFKRIASAHGIPNHVDPAFDLENPNLTSLAHNITAILGWRSYDNYLSDMKAMLDPRLTPAPLSPKLRPV